MKATLNRLLRVVTGKHNDPFQKYRLILSEGPAGPEFPLDSALDPARVELCDAWLAGWYPDDGALYPDFPIGKRDILYEAGLASEHAAAFCRARGAKLAAAGDAAMATRVICLDSPDPAALLPGLFTAGSAGALYLIGFRAKWHADALRDLDAATTEKRGFEKDEARALIEAAGLTIIREAGDGFYAAMTRVLDAGAPENTPHSDASLAWAGCWATNMAGPQGAKIQGAMNDLMPLRHLFVAVKPGGTAPVRAMPTPGRIWPMPWTVPEDTSIDALDVTRLAWDLERREGWLNKERSEVLPGLDVTPADTMIDLGCGDGNIAVFCAEQGAAMIVADIDPANVARTKERIAEASGRDARGIVTDSNPIPLNDCSVTRAVCTEVLEHVDDPDIVLAELFRIGRPGALYLLTVPGVLSEHTQAVLGPPQYFERPNHIRIVEPEGFRAMVERAGLLVDHYSGDNFHQSMNLIFCWQSGLPLGQPHHALTLWLRAWQMATEGRRGPDLTKALNAALPRRQIIIARKPAT